MAEKPKLWRYEADCKRVEELVKTTLAAGGRPGWANCVTKVLVTLRVTRPRSTPLALHFISLSAKEMLAKRHDNARLMLVTAYSLANKVVMSKVQELFKLIFAMPDPSQFLAAIGAALVKVQRDIEKLPEGLSNLEVAPGMKVQVIKKTLGKGKAKKVTASPFSGDPRLN